MMKTCLLFISVCLIFNGAFAWAETTYPMPKRPSEKLLKKGKFLYEYICAPCHGISGKGTGPVSATIKVKPRDFTRGVYRYRSTDTGQLPTQEDLYRSIMTGFHTTAMPSFSGLSPDDAYALVAYLMEFSERFYDELEYPLKIHTVPRLKPLTPASVMKGREVFKKMQCFKCHGPGGGGNGPSAPMLRDETGKKLYLPDFTRESKIKRARTREDIYLILVTGLNGASMPSYRSAMSDEELFDLVNYIYGFRLGMSLPLREEEVMGPVVMKEEK